ncbi:MAG: transposase family protein [Actinobacteria bacterium]|nr:MAG: transposase family protein [Actinomycetota bacterium]
MRRGCSRRPGGCASVRSGCTRVRSASRCPTRSGRPTRPRHGLARAPPRSSASSTTPAAKRGRTRRCGWTASLPPICCARSAPNGSARSSGRVASGLALRYDGGSCFRSHHYQVEIDHLGIVRSPAFHYEPETNGCVERFIQTLKEQVLWIERFETFEQLRHAVRSFARRYNREWLLERHGYRTPAEAREHLLGPAVP